MSNLLLLIIVALSAACLPLQAAVNARLRDYVVSPIYSALISFIVGGVLLGGLAAAGAFGRGRLSTLHHAPWWVWTGGACGAFVVTAALAAIPKIGARGVVAPTVFGQLLASLIMDQFGWLGIPRSPATATRIAGALLLFAGVILIQRRV